MWHTAKCNKTQLLVFVGLVLRKSESISVRPLAFILKAGKLRHKVIGWGQWHQQVAATGVSAWHPLRQIISLAYLLSLSMIQVSAFRMQKSGVWMVCLFLLWFIFLMPAYLHTYSGISHRCFSYLEMYVCFSYLHTFMYLTHLCFFFSLI